MEIENIKVQAEKLKEAFSNIVAKRKIWQEKTKPLLQIVLTEIAKEVSYLDLQVQTLDWTINSEGVNLLFNPRPSGLHTNRNPTGLPEPDEFRVYIKEGSYIVFAQMYSGDIIVNISYPFIEEYVTQAPINTLGRYKPDEITKEFILEKVSIFFNEMLKWETHSNSRAIGFASPSQ